GGTITKIRNIISDTSNERQERESIPIGSDAQQINKIIDREVLPEVPQWTQKQADIVMRLSQAKNFYELLDVPKTANEHEIRTAYKKLALQVHPDKNYAPGANEIFQRLASAVATLTDPEKRDFYNLRNGWIFLPSRDSAEYKQAQEVFYASKNAAEEIYKKMFQDGESVSRNKEQRNRENMWYTFAFVIIFFLILYSYDKKLQS
uniref:Uncharacterized protein n=1 Tax=Phlebotomus papatasi TaxID=29031 RepID=A0A1B0DA58_PHLPP